MRKLLICRPVSDPEMYRQYSFVAASIQKMEEAEAATE